MRAHLLGLLTFALGALTLHGCTGPCEQACENLVERCTLRVGSVSQAPEGEPRGCAQVKADAALDRALCLEQCQDWKAEAGDCLAALSCSGQPSQDQDKVDTCLRDRGRSDGEIQPEDQQSSCRDDCDRQARACGTACVTTQGDAQTCAGCYDNCDRSRARCRGWCTFTGQ